MTSIGALLAILGFGSLILPAFGMQFRLLSAVEGAQPWFGIILGVIGLVLMTLAGALGQSGALTPAYAVWLPNVVGLLVGAYLMREAAH